MKSTRNLFRPIHSEADYQAAMLRIEELYAIGEAHLTDVQRDELGALAILVQHYDMQHHPPPMANAADVIRFELERRGWTQRHLAQLMAVSPSRVNEFIRGHRELGKDEIRKIHHLLGIRLEVLFNATDDLARAA